jgi:hypothetical protein
MAYELQTPVFEHCPPHNPSSDWTNDVGDGDNEFDTAEEAEALFRAMAADWLSAEEHDCYYYRIVDTSGNSPYVGGVVADGCVERT